jgi:hypothetical protein
MYDTGTFVLDEWRSCTPGQLIGSDVVKWFQRRATRSATERVEGIVTCP